MRRDSCVFFNCVYCQYHFSCHLWFLLMLVLHLAVLLSQSQGQAVEKLVERHVNFRAEFPGEVQGNAHLDGLGQELSWSKTNNWLSFFKCIIATHNCVKLNENLICINSLYLTLKLAGSTRSLNACRSLSALRAPLRSSMWATASPIFLTITAPCFLTWADPGLRSDQWAK